MREREYASPCSPRLEDSSSERLPEPKTSSQPLPTQPACYEARRPVQHRCSLAPMRVDTRCLSTLSCVAVCSAEPQPARVCLACCLSSFRPGDEIATKYMFSACAGRRLNAKDSLMVHWDRPTTSVTSRHHKFQVPLLLEMVQNKSHKQQSGYMCSLLLG